VNFWTLSGKIFLIACVINKNEISFRSCVLQNVVNLKPQLHFILISLCELLQHCNFLSEVQTNVSILYVGFPSHLTHFEASYVCTDLKSLLHSQTEWLEQTILWFCIISLTCPSCSSKSIIFEKDKIFAYLNLQDDELNLYEKIVSFVERNIPKPDLVIYIQSSLEQLVKNIAKRNRSFESNISEEYLKELIEAYNYFFFRYKNCPLLIVNCTTIDFVNNKSDFDLLFDNIFKPTRLPIEYLNPITNL
jgi:hypothetical protein